jgi:hypothetical protein
MSFPEDEMILKEWPLRQEGEFVRLYEAKLLENQLALRNLIIGIDNPSRKAMEKTIASVQTLALDWTKQSILESSRLIFRPTYGAGKTHAFASLKSSISYTAFSAMIGAFAMALPKETLALTAEAVAQANRINFEILGAIAGSGALAALDFSTFRQDIGHIEIFQTSYSGQLASALRDILNEEEITDESVQPLEALISRKVAALPQNRVSAEGMFTLILTLLTVLMSYIIHRNHFLSNRELTDQSNQLSYLLRRMLENTERLIPQSDDNTYYRVERQVGLSARPKLGTYQGLLVPDQTVRLVERSHKWIFVEYFDQIHGIARSGWGPKKYFLQVPSVSAQPLRVSPKLASNKLTADEYLALTEKWEQTNKRRIELIYKKAEHNLAAEEVNELEKLQRLADARIRLFAPLPISSVESVLENFERRT